MGNRESSSAEADSSSENNKGTANSNGAASREIEVQRSPSRRSKERRRSRATSKSSNGTAVSSSDDVGSPPKRPKLSYWQMIRGGYNQLVNAIIRPPRANYEIGALGPERFRLRGRRYVRCDFELVNERGMKLQCSHWKPDNMSAGGSMPCIVYLHGNASCRAEALECLPLILSSGISLFSLDFSGSGKSDGKYISLGWFERDDVQTVVNHLRSQPEVSCIGLFGRSMGAVTALMHGDRDPSIACMVLDSTFSSLRQLSRELVDHAQVSIPRFAVGIALRMVRSSVRSRAGFDINKLEPIAHAEKCFIPSLFGAARGDVFIQPHHSQDVHDRFSGDKNIILFDGDHNTPRPRFFYDSVGVFLHNTMIAPFSQLHEASSIPAYLGELGGGIGSRFAMPAPLSASGAGIGISVGTSDYSSQQGDEEEAYYEAMLQKALEMSLEASNSQSNAQSQSQSAPPPLAPSNDDEAARVLTPGGSGVGVTLPLNDGEYGAERATMSSSPRIL